MEDLYGWLIVFAGATIGLLGTFLFTSERELKNKRRECEELRANQTAGTRNRSTEAQPSETHASTELRAKNKELGDQISALSSRLEQSQKAVEELQNLQGQFASAQAEEVQLQETITNLRNQLQVGKTQLDESDRRRQEAADLNSQLQNEIVQLQQQLQENQKAETALRAEQGSLLLNTQAENQRLSAANQQQQEEIANLRSQLQTSEALLSDSANQCQERADHESRLQSELDELKGQMERLAPDKQKLSEQIDSLSSKLSASERSLDELRTMHHDKQSENQQLQAANQELQRQTAEIAERLHTSENRLGELATDRDESAARCAQLRSEIADVKLQAEESQAKTREIEALQQQLANVESREAIFRDRQQELEAQIADLQGKLATENEKVQELDAVREQVAKREEVCEELRQRNRRLEVESASWQDRLAGSEESQREVARLRQQLEELRMAHALLAGRNWQLQKATHTIELTQEAIEPEVPNQVAAILDDTAVSEVNSPNSDLSENNGNHVQLSLDDSALGNQGANGGAKKAAVGALGERTWRFRLVLAGLVFLIGGVVVGFLATRSSKDPAAMSETVFHEPPEPIEPPLIAEETKPPPHLRGAFKITRPTQVYSGPSENSARIANVGPGMKINVVDSLDGWLEIRSKHGRPPGFVRQENAVRID